VTLNLKEQMRLRLLNDLEARTTTAQHVLPAPVPQAGITSEIPGLSVRHVYRLQARYRLKAAAARVHGNRGRPPPH